MKNKRIISMIASLGICVSSLTALNVNSCIESLPELENEGTLELFDDKGYYLPVAIGQCSELYRIYKTIKYDSTFYYMQCYSEKSFSFRYMPSADTETIQSVINEIIAAYDSTYTTRQGYNEYYGHGYCYVCSEDSISNPMQIAMGICTALKEKNLISDFEYEGYSGEYTAVPIIPRFNYIAIPDDEAVFTQVTEYIAEKYPNISLIQDDYTAKAVTSVGTQLWYMSSETTLTDTEKLDIIIDLSEKFSAYSPCGVLESSSTITYPDRNFYDTQYGDADGDGELSVNDVVKAMCYSLSDEKYGLTELQLVTADVYQAGDGVNSSDAYTIQKKLVNLVESLPEK